MHLFSFAFNPPAQSVRYLPHLLLRSPSRKPVPLLMPPLFVILFSALFLFLPVTTTRTVGIPPDSL